MGSGVQSAKTKKEEVYFHIPTIVYLYFCRLTIKL